MTDKIDTQSRHITKAGSNIFADLGFEPAEADSLLTQSREEINRVDELKKQLMTEVSEWMTANGHKQIEAAKILHVSRPRVSDVVNLKTEKFTIDSLVGMVAAMGKKVQLVIE
ncbi:MULTISPECIES: helix-turn-helix domain-containing protein [unclassified Pantoea]|uniref:helix-turn-helix domain-containing protein n=1 Tax=unclassified Pantoea TaxID=2630326 RepID=UPI001CD2026A|nr:MULTISPECIES: XRE family transcriptional regulator [unclassified Pantoea]MCA1177699.1 XRE family transcriptional regulator [Pantoea sp. alder69]MCA1252830.1 XRE family transcriptional regulator [Pantoea sp. alder70]MCA1266537.1 XRE family transcriptional regulator [Pantoea sp. alder81]